jgi:hypothetical protein
MHQCQILDDPGTRLRVDMSNGKGLAMTDVVKKLQRARMKAWLFVL